MVERLLQFEAVLPKRTSPERTLPPPEYDDVDARRTREALTLALPKKRLKPPAIAAIQSKQTQQTQQTWHLKEPVCETFIRDIFLRDTLTFAKYFELVQFSDIGYYEDKIIFITDTSDRDSEEARNHYQTKASRGLYLACGFAEQLYVKWRTLCEKQILQPEDPFTVWELGPGEGHLSIKILTYIEERAKQENDDEREHLHSFSQFYKAIQYCMIDRCKKLHGAQKRQAQNSPYHDKIVCHLGNALHLKKTMPHDAHAPDAIIANELHDMLIPSKLRVSPTREGSIETACVVVSIDQQALKSEFGLSAAEIANLEAESQQYAEQMDRVFDRASKGRPTDPNPTIYLTASIFENLLKIYGSPSYRGHRHIFKMQEVYVPVSCSPNDTALVKGYPDILEGMQPGDTKYMASGMDKLAKSITEMATPHTIGIMSDYFGSNTQLRNYRIHVIGQGYSVQDWQTPYFMPTQIDLSTRANVTQWRQALRAFGWDNFHYYQLAQLPPSSELAEHSIFSTETSIFRHHEDEGYQVTEFNRNPGLFPAPQQKLPVTSLDEALLPHNLGAGKS